MEEQLARYQMLAAWRLGLEAEADQLLAYIRDANRRVELILHLFREYAEVLPRAFAGAESGDPSWDQCQAELCELKTRMRAYQKG